MKKSRIASLLSIANCNGTSKERLKEKKKKNTIQNQFYRFDVSYYAVDDIQFTLNVRHRVRVLLVFGRRNMSRLLFAAVKAFKFVTLSTQTFNDFECQQQQWHQRRRR